MSRLIIRGLTPHIQEAQLKEYFSAFGEVTDVRVKRRPDGRSRQFAFLGFRQMEQANLAIERANMTFLGTCRLTVELARGARDESLIAKKRLKLRSSVADATASISPPTGSGQDRGSRKMLGKKHEEYLAATRGVDDLRGSELPPPSDSVSEPDKQQEKEGETQTPIAPEKMSDLDYLRSKVSRAVDWGDKSPDPATPSQQPELPSDDKAAIETEEKTVPDGRRLFVTNLSYLSTEDEVRRLCEVFGEVEEVHLPLDSLHQPRGFGFVRFAAESSAVAARSALDGQVFQGRVLRAVAAQAPKHQEIPAAPSGRLSSFQAEKETERRAMAGKSEGWNAAFVRSDAVIEVLAERLQLQPSDILDVSRRGGDVAVRLAVAETQLLAENKADLSSHGVDLEALESLNSASHATRRSDTTILIKNLPPRSDEDELRDMFCKFGAVVSFVMPRSRTLALIDFVEASEARAAFKGLAYRRYRNSPLFLEWAPLGTIKKQATKATKPVEGGKETKAEELEDEDFATLFIKNLDFATTDQELEDFISHKLRLEGLRTAVVQKKIKGEVQLSQGFGFAEFKSPALAQKALAVLQGPGAVLRGHRLEVKPSDKRVSQIRSRTKAGGEDKKLVVRNLAFQATKGELEALFAAFGTVKSVRVPKAVMGRHRGFAFIELSTHQEAATAMAQLASTHFYGRHLVIEWAKQETGEAEQESELRKRARMDQAVLRSGEMKRMKERERHRTEGEEEMEIAGEGEEMDDLL